MVGYRSLTMCEKKKNIKEKKKHPTCTLPRATFAGGALSLLGCSLSIASALLPWVQCPLKDCCSLHAQCAPALATAMALGMNTTAAIAAISGGLGGDILMMGLIAPCEVVSKVPSCARFDRAGFSPTPSGQGAAALLVMGFMAGLLGFFGSIIAALGCCVTPRMLRFRFSVALLALLFSGAGAVVGGAFLQVPGGTLADLMKANVGWVGSGLGVAIAGTLLQLFALLVVVGTCCCQPNMREPLTGAAAGEGAATPRSEKRANRGGEEAVGDAEEGKGTVNPLGGKNIAEAAPKAARNPFKGMDAAHARDAFDRAQTDYDEVGKEELLEACRALKLEGASTKKAAFAQLQLHFGAAPAATPKTATTHPFKEAAAKEGALKVEGNPFQEGGATATPTLAAAGNPFKEG